MKAPIHSEKHYFQISLSTATTGATNEEILIQSAAVPTGVNQVTEGAIVKAVFLEIWAIGTTADQFFTAIVVKLEGGALAPATANMAALGTYTNKKNILYTTQGLASNDGIAMPLPLFKGWIKIPKGKQRFGLGDELGFFIAS